jgi:hypothetical protein
MSKNGTKNYENSRVTTRRFEMDNAVPLNTEVRIVADRKVSITGPGNYSLGRVISLPTNGFPGNVGVMMPYNYDHTVTAGATVTAGDRIKQGTNGADGRQRWVPFVAGTDEPGLERGIAITGAAENEEFDALFK